MKFFPDNKIGIDNQLYKNENEVLIELKKKLIFTRNGDGKDLFQKYQRENFASCFCVDYEYP